MVQLDKVDNTSDSEEPISTATKTALDLKANQASTYTKGDVDAKINNLVNNLPAALNTLTGLAQALGNADNFSTTVINSIDTRAPKQNPTFSGNEPSN